MLGIDGVDEAAGTVFFPANKDDPRQLQIFSVQLDGSGFKQLTTEEGMHFANFCRRRQALYPHLSWTADVAAAALVRGRWRMQPGVAGARWIAEYGLRAPKYLEFKADDGTILYGRLLLPPDGRRAARFR